MKNQESELFIDKVIVKYQALSIKEKTIIHLTAMVYLVLLSIGLFYIFYFNKIFNSFTFKAR